MKILRNFLTYLWFNLYFMARCWRLKMLKRFRFGGQDSVTNPNPNIIRLAKITNPNPNIRDSEEKIRIRIRIRIFVTTLSLVPLSLENLGFKPDQHKQARFFSSPLNFWIINIKIPRVWKLFSGKCFYPCQKSSYCYSTVSLSQCHISRHHLRPRYLLHSYVNVFPPPCIQKSKPV